MSNDKRRPLCPVCWFPGTRDGVLLQRCREEKCHVGERVRTIDDLYNRIRTTAADENAKQIGELQGRVVRLEGQVQYLMGPQARPSKAMQRLVEAAKALGQDAAVLADGSVPGRSHEDSGMRCLVWHDQALPPCIKCKYCGEWIRPEDMGVQCKGHDVPV